LVIHDSNNQAKEGGFHAAEGEIPLMAVIREYLIDGHILVR
jgi:hypothetical protein